MVNKQHRPITRERFLKLVVKAKNNRPEMQKIKFNLKSIFNQDNEENI